MMARGGVRVERWSADDIRQREPAVTGPTVGGYFFPDDAHCKPYEAVRVLADRKLPRLASRFVEGAGVFDISPATAGA